MPTCGTPSAFLGFELHVGARKLGWGRDGRGQRRLPEANVARFHGRLRGLRDQWRAGTVTREEVAAKVQAWIAHAGHADTFWLRQALFEGGWYEVVEGW